MNARAKLTKRTSLNLLEGDYEVPNFKKKFNYNVYHSLILPETK